MPDLQEIISAIVGIFIIVIFLGALLPAFATLNPISAIVFFIAMILLIIGIILSVFKDVLR